MTSARNLKDPRSLVGLALCAAGLLGFAGPAAAAGCPSGDTCVVVKPGEKIRIAPMFSKTGAGGIIGADNARGLFIAHEARHQVRGREVELVGNPGDEFTLENGISVPNWDDASSVSRANLLLSN